MDKLKNCKTCRHWSSCNLPKNEHCSELEDGGINEIKGMKNA